MRRWNLCLAKYSSVGRAAAPAIRGAPSDGGGCPFVVPASCFCHSFHQAERLRREEELPGEGDIRLRLCALVQGGT